jgi:DNA-binding MarR family transcriptional regulator
MFVNGATLVPVPPAMLDRLEKAGLIERRPNPNDRRGTLIAPQASSAEKMAGWFESARKAQHELINSYSEQDLQIICDVFERFARLWDQERDKLSAQPNPQQKKSPS